jgi:2-dehydro-3-deoxyphosphogluconate aldolase/(4S)-4-hydroxy-2-oxoglutarate aldolase
MRSRSEIISLLGKPGIIAVIRADTATQAEAAAEALVEGGVLAIEITMTTPNAIEAIRNTAQKLGESALVGVGTVLDTATCTAAISAGAEFVVSPVGRRELVDLAHAADKPVMLGAYTPTEAQSVHEAGADFVKLFPAEGLGPLYVKALRAPLPHLRIVPTGGVDLQNVAEWFAAGCAAVGVGSLLVARDILQRGDWAALTHRATEFVSAAARP